MHDGNAGSALRAKRLPKQQLLGAAAAAREHAAPWQRSQLVSARPSPEFHTPSQCNPSQRLGASFALPWPGGTSLPSERTLELQQVEVNLGKWGVRRISICVSGVEGLETLPPATAWMSLENIVLNERSQTQKPYV